MRQLKGEDRFIDLHPLDTQGSQAVEGLVIQRQQAVEWLQFVDITGLGCGLPQVAQRAQQHRLDRMAQGCGLRYFLEKLFPVQGKLLVVTGQHLAVPGNVADWQQFYAGVFLHLPQLMVAAGVWKAQVMCQCHVLSLQHA